MSDTVYSKIKIEDLPEVFTVLPTDHIYVFQEQHNGEYAKLEIPIATLSTYFHGKDSAEKLKTKTAELVKLSGEFVEWLKTNYPTASYISANYSTEDYFNEIYNPIKAESSLSVYLSQYASKEYGAYKLAEAKSTYEQMKLENVIESGTDIITGIETETDTE